MVGTTFAFQTLLAATTARGTTQWWGWRQRAQECFAQLPNGAPGLRGGGKTVFKILLFSRRTEHHTPRRRDVQELWKI